MEVVLKDGPLEAYLQRCQQEYQKQQEEANQQLVGIRKPIEVTEYRLEKVRIREFRRVGEFQNLVQNPRLEVSLAGMGSGASLKNKHPTESPSVQNVWSI